MENSVFIGLGSNQGEMIKNCNQAIEEILKLDGCSLIAKSSWYYTQPWGKEDQDWFVNGVIQIRTHLNPHELLLKLKEIESQLGRKYISRWGPRSIDADILFYGHLRFKSSDLEIPHPRIHQRKFVLIPMAEIAPHFIHPVFHKTIVELLNNVSDSKKVIRVIKGIYIR